MINSSKIVTLCLSLRYALHSLPIHSKIERFPWWPLSSSVNCGIQLLGCSLNMQLFFGSSFLSGSTAPVSTLDLQAWEDLGWNVQGHSLTASSCAHCQPLAIFPYVPLEGGSWESLIIQTWAEFRLQWYWRLSELVHNVVTFKTRAWGWDPQSPPVPTWCILYQIGHLTVVAPTTKEGRMTHVLEYFSLVLLDRVHFFLIKNVKSS